jgi:hypothetical protein
MWSISDPSEAFRLHSNYALPSYQTTATPEDRVVRPDYRMEAIQSAIRKFCATANSYSCSLYTSSAGRCYGLVGAGTSALRDVREAKKNGASNNQAVSQADVAAQGWARHAIMSGAPPAYDLSTQHQIAVLAAEVPNSVTEQEFELVIINQCLWAIS